MHARMHTQELGSEEYINFLYKNYIIVREQNCKEFSFHSYLSPVINIKKYNGEIR